MKSLGAVLWACLLLVALAASAEETNRVPRSLAPILQRAQQALGNQQPDLALQTLQAYQAEDHALRQLLLGHAFREKADWKAALAAYHRALELDPSLVDARKGLTHIYARQEQWTEAATVLGQFVNPWTTEADWLALYAQAAIALQDHRLARILIEAGLTRFPTDQRFRRLDLARLISTGDFPQAKTAVRHLLQADPANARLWEQYASAAFQAGAEEEHLIALEAALLADPEDLDRHRQFLSSLLLAGDWLTALEHGERLLANRLAGQVDQHPAIMELLIRAADAGRRDDLISDWLRLVKEPTKTMRLAEARSALRQGQSDRARSALRLLIASGETDGSIFLWAGNLAESAGATAEAESDYVEAARSGGSAATLAPLYLARLCHGLGRSEEAVRVLKQHLEKHPEDAAARALLSSFTPSIKTK